MSITLLSLSLSVSGCALILPGQGHYEPAKASSVRCEPNETWDGAQCRHKGRGSGARKHDN